MRAAALAGLLLAGCAGAPPSGEEPFPPAGLPPGWSPAGDRQRLLGADLYGYIDGAAEAYLELGFIALELRDYACGEDAVRLELYQMADEPAALGAYLARGGAEAAGPGDPATPGGEAHLLVRGSRFAAVLNASRTPGAARALPEFARRLAERLPAGTGPDPLAALPREGRVPGSARILRGTFTLQSVCWLGDGDVLGLEGLRTAVAADYAGGPGPPVTVILADYGGAEAARAALRRLASRLDPFWAPILTTETELVLKSGEGRYAAARTAGARLRLEINLPTPPGG